MKPRSRKKRSGKPKIGKSKNSSSPPPFTEGDCYSPFFLYPVFVDCFIRLSGCVSPSFRSASFCQWYLLSYLFLCLAYPWVPGWVEKFFLTLKIKLKSQPFYFMHWPRSSSGLAHFWFLNYSI